MNNEQEQMNVDSLLDSILQKKAISEHEEYTQQKQSSLKKVKYKQPFSEAYAKEISVLRDIAFGITIVVSSFLLSYIHYICTTPQKERNAELYALHLLFCWCLLLLLIIFSYIAKKYLFKVKKYFKTLGERRKIRLLPLTAEERQQNNLNSFLAYSSWLVNTFTSDNIFKIDEQTKVTLKKSLETLFRKDFHIDSECPMFVSFLCSEDNIKEDSYRLTENIYLYITEYEEIGKYIYIYLCFR